MRRVLFLAFWLLVSFLSPVSIQSRSYEPPRPDVTLASLSPVFAVAHAQTAQVLAQATADTLSVKSTYTFAAEAGDGITHLARKAVSEYLNDTDQADTFTRAQKVYLEDFLQNHIGTFWLSLGQTESFATNEIESAITAVNGVDTNNLAANLAKYVSKVDWQKYESLAFARSSESQSQSSVDKNQEDSATTDNQGNTDGSAAQTQNSNTNRTRTVVYIIIVVIILAIAGYLLFRGTEDDTQLGSRPMAPKPSRDEKPTASVPETKKEAPTPKTEIKPEVANGSGSNGSAPTPMKEGVQMHIGEQSKTDYTKSENSGSK